MALSEAKKAADKRHNAKLDQIMIRPYKERGAQIRKAAAAHGMSLQAYILEAVQMRMEREGEPSPAPQEAAAAPVAVLEAAAAAPEEPVPVQAEPDTPPEVPASEVPEAQASVPSGEEPPAAPTGPLPIEKRFPIERLGIEVLKLDEEESGQEILRLERVMVGGDLMMVFCNMTAEDRTEWKRRRQIANDLRRTQLSTPKDVQNSATPF